MTSCGPPCMLLDLWLFWSTLYVVRSVVVVVHSICSHMMWNNLCVLWSTLYVHIWPCPTYVSCGPPCMLLDLCVLWSTLYVVRPMCLVVHPVCCYIDLCVLRSTLYVRGPTCESCEVQRSSPGVLLLVSLQTLCHASTRSWHHAPARCDLRGRTGLRRSRAEQERGMNTEVYTHVHLDFKNFYIWSRDCHDFCGPNFIKIG